MRKLFALLIACIIFSACNRAVCPAYMNGEATGTEGSGSKKSELFPKEMRKK